jgi:hypothetical protein
MAKKSNGLARFAPFESPSHQAFLQAAEAAGQDTEILRDILWLINAHDHLVAFNSAATCLATLLGDVPKHWQSTVNELGLLAWVPALQWSISERARLSKVVGSQYLRVSNSGDGNPVMGQWQGATGHPAYTALCSLLPLRFPSEYRLLIGQFALAHIAAVRENSLRSDYESHVPDTQWEALPTKPDDAARAIRAFGEQAHETFVRGLALTNSPQEFAESLEGVSAIDDLSEARRDALCRFLQKCWGLLDWNERDYFAADRIGSGGGSRWLGARVDLSPRVWTEELPIGDPDDPAAGWGRNFIVSARTADVGKQKRALKSDLCPNELDDDEDVVLSDHDCRESRRDLGAVARSARSKGRHVALSNQLFPWNYYSLTMSEVGELIRQSLTALHQLLDKPASLDTRIRIQSIAMLHVMLWTGSDIARASKLYVVAEEPDSNSGIDFAITLNSKQQSGTWWIRSITPDYATAHAEPAGQVRERAPFIGLADLISGGWFVRRAMAAAVTGKKDVGRVFSFDEDRYRKCIRGWLSLTFPDGRITEAKIAGFLEHRLQVQAADPAVVAAITGQPHRLATVRLFYTSPSIGVLQDHYQRAFVALRDKVYDAVGGGKETIRPIAPARNPAHSIGSRLCPTREAVKSMISRLKNDLRSASRYRDRTDFIRYHNLYTLYTILSFGYATTCRAIGTPYLPIEDVDPKTGLASISDKDDETCHKTRLVWIPEFMREHMAHHNRHHRQLVFQVPRTRRKALREPCFFLDEGMLPEEVRPGTIEPLLASYLAVPANTHRRFIRTELFEAGCPPEVIDALMGHWQQGEEPFGRFSSFSFATYVTELEKYLLPLLEDLGFNSVRSALAG